MTPWFIATKRFDSNNQGWASYIEFSGLGQLTEVVSLDGLICPSLPKEFKEEYWPYVVQEDFLLHYFLDFDFLTAQIAGLEGMNVLCVFRNPVEQPTAPLGTSWEFIGFDLVNKKDSISALTNCGGYPDVFANAELTCFGLLPELKRANEVQNQLRKLYPEDPHADCYVFAIFRELNPILVTYKYFGPVD